MRNLNFNGESGSEPYTPTSQSVAGEDFYSPEFRGDFGAGLLDLHAMDDTELLSEGGRPLTSGSMAAARLALKDSLTKRCWPQHEFPHTCRVYKTTGRGALCHSGLKVQHNTRNVRHYSRF
ncbi:uncharacterized protein LOC141634303 isoform X1 [Silene latifolia]|uniref:uncharacterized protein LOC141634303 isoform X1 n=1 Tax=Silene latifolia TaxID=37657 RepID=UPI003D7721BB